MGLESGTYVNDLVTSNPDGGVDTKAQGDDHLRLIKSVLKNTFPNATRAFRFDTVPATKVANYPVVAADENALIRVDASGGAKTVTLPILSAVFAGWKVTVMKIDSSTNAVTIVGTAGETLNGAASKLIDEQYLAKTFQSDGTEWKEVSNSQTIPSGIIQAYGGATAPTGWLLCYGQAVSRTTYAALFSVISTSFGSGDATSTFNVPDLRGRVPLGKDNMGGSSANRVTDTEADTVGSASGGESVAPTGSLANESSHTHDPGTLVVASHTHTEASNTGPSAAPPTGVASGGVLFVDSLSHTHPIGAGITGATAPAVSGGATAAGSAHTHGLGTVVTDVVQPYQTVNYIIKT